VLTQLAWVCVGGAVGSGARYLVSGWALQRFGPGFPWGTLAVNVVGSFLLGALMYVGLQTTLLSPTLRLALTTGVMGGFTTYSTFNYETVEYLRERAWWMGALNVTVTLLGCLGAGVLGLGLARWVFGPR
jgi:CrcB protein